MVGNGLAKKSTGSRTMKTAIITGITGQDGSLLADILLEKGYQVVGLSRQRSGEGDWRIKHLYKHPSFRLEYADITDSGSLYRAVKDYQPDEFYNLAAMSFVGLSWDKPELSGNVTGLGVLRCLEAIRNVKPDTKFYQASSSEIFGKVQEIPQKETTPLYPRSPYGCAKAYGYYITRNYRESYGIFACNGILFNHEGPRRGLEFVTRKITDGLAKIVAAGNQGQIRLGRLDVKRDWGNAYDYMQAAHLMLQQPVADDYVIATGETHTIEEFLTEAFTLVGLDWRNHVIQDEKFIRPAEVDILIGDASKAHKILGWKPQTSFKELVRSMVKADLERHGHPRVGV